MACIKCGRETGSDAVFCDACVSEMKKYPVNPNIPIVLPSRSPGAVKKPVRRKTVSHEEAVSILKGRIRLLCILLTAVSILAALLIYPAMKYLMEDRLLPGQNYTSIVSKTSETTHPEQ